MTELIQWFLDSIARKDLSQFFVCKTCSFRKYRSEKVDLGNRKIFGFERVPFCKASVDHHRLRTLSPAPCDQRLL